MDGHLDILEFTPAARDLRYFGQLEKNMSTTAVVQNPTFEDIFGFTPPLATGNNSVVLTIQKHRVKTRLSALAVVAHEAQTSLEEIAKKYAVSDVCVPDEEAAADMERADELSQKYNDAFAQFDAAAKASAQYGFGFSVSLTDHLPRQ